MPGDDIVESVYESVKDMVDDNDIVCVTEAVVARAQQNYVTTQDVADEIRRKMNIKENGSIGVVFPIASRNRFLLILKSIAKAVNKGKVVLQLSFPNDEVGNPIIEEDFIQKMGKSLNDKISFDELKNKNFSHPFTGVDYISLYSKAIKDAGAEPEIFLSNDPREIINHHPDGIIVSSIHSKEKIKKEIEKDCQNCLTLQDLCSDKKEGPWSEWGLLGSNAADEEGLKLAPKEADKVAKAIQDKIKGIGKKVEVIIYGDGAYKDPDTGIYELADPEPCVGLTERLRGEMRGGIKYKFFVSRLYKQKQSREAIEEFIANKKKESYEKNNDSTTGTTPRKLAHITASLADLVSGSSDAGTPIVIVRNILT